MDELRRIWSHLPDLTVLIKGAVPWDVGDSELALWGSAVLVAAFWIAVAKIFTWLFAKGLVWLLRPDLRGGPPHSN